MPLGAIINGIANIATTQMGQASAESMQRMQNQFNMMEAAKNRRFQTSEREAAQQFNIDMWNMNNEYNSPAKQMERLKEAGISPSAMMQGGQQQFSSSAPVTTPQMGSQATSDGGALASTILNTYSNIGKNTADMVNTFAQARATDYQTKYNQKTEQQRIELLNTQLKKDYTQIEKWLSEKGINNLTYEQLEETNKWIAQFKSVELQKMLKELNILDNEALVKEKQATLLDEQAKTEGVERDLIGSQKNLNETQNQIQGEELKLLQQKVKFSDKFGVPLDAPEFAVLWEMKEKGCLEDYIENIITKPERGKWKPKDYQYDEEKSSAKLGWFGEWGLSIKGRKGSEHEERKRINAKRYMKENNYKTPTFDDLNFTD